MNYFRNSKYIDIIKVIGENIEPIKYSDLKEKIKLGDSTLYRSLIWLQNIDAENGIKSTEVKAFNLLKEAYIETTDISKSKNNTYKLTSKGNTLYNTLFLKEKNISLVDELIQDYKIYEKLWDFIGRNKVLFYNQLDNQIQPWVFQLFEFFEKLDESELIIILEKISGPKNLKLYNLFGLLTSILFTHPLWEKYAQQENIEIPILNENQINLLEDIPYIGKKFQAFGFGPNRIYIIKSDELIREICSLVEKHLKRYYWKTITYNVHKELIRKDIISFVFNDLYKKCPEYLDFINQYYIEILLLIKSNIKEISSNGNVLRRLPLNLLSVQDRKNLEFHLRRKLILSNIEEIPSQLLKLGASNETILQEIEKLKVKTEIEPNNLKLKFKLLEILIYNYFNAFRTDYEFYEKFKIEINKYIEDLIEELTSSNSKIKEDTIILGYLFYNKVRFNLDKAISFNESLINRYPDYPVLYKNLIQLFFYQNPWNIEKINEKIVLALKVDYSEVYFIISSIMIKIIREGISSGHEFKSELLKLIELKSKPSKIIQVVSFFVNQLHKKELNELSLRFLELMMSKFDYSELRLLYAQNLLKEKRNLEALEEFLKLIDIFPNYLLERELLKILFNPFDPINDLSKNKNLSNFLNEIIELINISKNSYQWHTSENNYRDFEEKREEHLSILRKKLKDINKLLKNDYSITLPLKFKALFLKALDRDKNLESCLTQILNISPDHIWANTEMALLLFKKRDYEQAFRILEYVEELKKKENYSRYDLSSPVPYILKESSYNIFQLYKEAGRFYEATLLMEDFLLNKYSQQDINITATTIGKDLIYCYHEQYKNTDKVMEKVLTLNEKLENMRDKNKDSNYINIQKDSSYIRQCLIEYLFQEQEYKKCLNYILDMDNKKTKNIDTRNSFFKSFDIITFYKAECYLKLNDLFQAKENYEQALEVLNNDIMLNATHNLLLIQPFPDYLKIKKKEFYFNRITQNLKKINKILNQDYDLKKLVYKTNVEKSIGNITLLIKEGIQEKTELIQQLLEKLSELPKAERDYIEMIIACSFAILDYIDEMFRIINKKNIEKAFPTLSILLKIFYWYYREDLDRYVQLCNELYGVIPDSSIPLLLNLYYLRYKKGIFEIEKLYNIFKKVWKTSPFKTTIYGIEGKILNYLKINLGWYPFNWAIDYERNINKQKIYDINLIFKVLDYIHTKKLKPKKELLEFITRSMGFDENIPKFLKSLLTSKSYKNPETKYFIYKELKPEIDDHNLYTYGEIAYRSNKLKEFLPVIEIYRNKELEKYKKNKSIERNRKWLEEKYLFFLLNCYEYNKTKDLISKSLNYLRKIEDYSKERIKYFEVILIVRDKRYRDAEINSFQLLKEIHKERSSRWVNVYFELWILNYFLYNLENEKPINIDELFTEIDKTLDFGKLNKKPIYFKLLILDVLGHELLENYEVEMSKIAPKLFTKIINYIDWNDQESHNIIIEKIYFNRDKICKFPLEIIESLNLLIKNLVPDYPFIQIRKNYLFYMKAKIYYNNNKLQKAKKILKTLFNSLDQEELYSTYSDINDLSLEVLKNISIF